jgi:hypothetical protein
VSNCFKSHVNRHVIDRTVIGSVHMYLSPCKEKNTLFILVFKFFRWSTNSTNSDKLVIIQSGGIASKLFFFCVGRLHFFQIFWVMYKFNQNSHFIIVQSGEIDSLTTLHFYSSIFCCWLSTEVQFIHLYNNDYNFSLYWETNKNCPCYKGK